MSFDCTKSINNFHTKESIIMNDHLDVGDVVDIYQDPVTKKKFECKAFLRDHLDEDEWMVEFVDEEGQTFRRTVIN